MITRHNGEPGCDIRASATGGLPRPSTVPPTALHSSATIPASTVTKGHRSSCHPLPSNRRQSRIQKGPHSGATNHHETLSIVFTYSPDSHAISEAVRALLRRQPAIVSAAGNKAAA